METPKRRQSCVFICSYSFIYFYCFETEHMPKQMDDNIDLPPCLFKPAFVRSPVKSQGILTSNLKHTVW